MGIGLIQLVIVSIRQVYGAPHLLIRSYTTTPNKQLQLVGLLDRLALAA